MRYSCLLFALALLGGCSPPSQEAAAPQTRLDTVSYHDDEIPHRVEVRRDDSLLEERTYRPTGRLRSIETSDTLRTYLDLHDPDSAAVLKDYLQGRWRNLSADTSLDQASTYYVFEEDRLTFEDASRTPLESLGIEYQSDRILRTDEGMSVQPEITSFDTVRVTGFTLIRLTDPAPR